MKRLLCITGVLLSMGLFLPMGGDQAAKKPDDITVIGVLARVAGIGGETTGWAIEFDTEIELQGERVKSIEVSGDSREFDRLENKHVQARGRLAVRRGTTRGQWSILEVSSIRESHAKHVSVRPKVPDRRTLEILLPSSNSSLRSLLNRASLAATTFFIESTTSGKIL